MPASINADVSLKEKASGNVVGVLMMNGVPGSQYGGYDYDSGTRLAESYAKLAKEIRKWMVKNVSGSSKPAHWLEQKGGGHRPPLSLLVLKEDVHIRRTSQRCSSSFSSL
ncbi:MAG: hypothetical protein IPK99_10060 [Flavobacteriales bacterium]|nr:hypothetical protein [Flavobacteriales bacterium]